MNTRTSLNELVCHSGDGPDAVFTARKAPAFASAERLMTGVSKYASSHEVQSMNVAHLKWLWKMSESVNDEGGSRKQIFDRARILKRRLTYLVQGARLISPLQVFMHPRTGSPLQRALALRPQLAGAVIWPYICTSWDARTRLQRIDEHFRVIESMTVLDFPVNEQMALLDLADVASNLRVVLDQPKWFMREGMLVLNLFAKDARIYSLAFSFALERDKVVAHVGAIQGVDTEGIMDEYKGLTKALHGMRPRDFQVELLRIFCRCLGVSRIYAVADDKRQHRSSYFGAAKSDVLFLNYDAIWEERGGVRDSGDFFVLPIETPMKLDKVPSKKRAMYRRRYELLQSLEKRMQAALNMSPMAPF